MTHVKTKALATAIAFTLLGLAIVPAQAGGWGRGPSWSQARKIINQADTDAKNGAKVIIDNAPTIGAIGAFGICVATGGRCGGRF